MTTFEVEVCRISYGFKTIIVESNDIFDAQKKALELAPNYEFSEKSAEYEISEHDTMLRTKTIIDNYK